jgi:hypothetical protein
MNTSSPVHAITRTVPEYGISIGQQSQSGFHAPSNVEGHRGAVHLASRHDAKRGSGHSYVGSGRFQSIYDTNYRSGALTISVRISQGRELPEDRVVLG